MERGPAGNTSLAAALALARELDEDRTLVVQETEYTGAGKHPLAQLAMAREMGVRNALSNSLGFGGHNASIIVGEAD